MYFGGRVDKPCSGLDTGFKGGGRRIRGDSHFLSRAQGCVTAMPFTETGGTGGETDMKNG